MTQATKARDLDLNQQQYIRLRANKKKTKRASQHKLTALDPWVLSGSVATSRKEPAWETTMLRHPNPTKHPSQ